MLGRATDRVFRLRKGSASCSTPNRHESKKGRDRAIGVSPTSERGTTQNMVKVLKCQLSAKGRILSLSQNNREVGLEAAIL